MSSSFTSAQALAFPCDPGEDRLATFEHKDALIVVVADGAGGLSGGAVAAELLIELVQEAVAAPAFEPRRPKSWIELLARADLVLEAHPHAGETTAVVVAVSEQGLVGASCGDSGAWVLGVDRHLDDLTAGQHPKLRLGGGQARPVPFTRPKLDGTLLVATDGLFNYAPAEQIAQAARQQDLARAAKKLMQLVRLPSGGLQDDVAVVAVKANR